MRTVLTAAVLLLVIDTGAASAQRWKPPADNQRCPSKWGAGDQRGSANHMKLVEPLKIQGGTGSTMAPIAIR